MDLIQIQIKKAQKNNQLICICLGKIDWSHRIIGHVQNIGATDGFKLECIDEFGQKSKTRKVLFSSIKSLEIGGTYNKNLDFLNKKGFVKNRSKPKYFFAKKENLYKKLRELKEMKSLCTFFFDTEFSIGVVKKITPKELFIMNVAYDGTKDGISVFDLASLTKIRTRSNFENRISFLVI